MRRPRVEYFTPEDFWAFLEKPDYKRFLYNEEFHWVLPAEEWQQPLQNINSRIGLKISLSQHTFEVARKEGRAYCCSLRDGNVVGYVYLHIHPRTRDDFAAFDAGHALRAFATKLWPKVPWAVKVVHIFISHLDRSIFLWAIGVGKAAAMYLPAFTCCEQICLDAKVIENKDCVLVITKDGTFVLNLSEFTIAESELLEVNDV